MGYGNYSIGRSGDRSFFLKTQEGVLSHFHVDDSSIKFETAFNLTEKATELYVKKQSKHPGKEFKTIRFTHAGRKWKIVEKEKEIWHSYILKFFQIIFFHKPATLSTREFTIESAWFASGKHDQTRAKARLVWKKVIPHCTDRYNYQMLNEAGKLGPISPKEYKEGIRGKISLSQEPKHVHEQYADPYTRLATFAFERFEPYLKLKDHVTPLDCKYRIILEKDELQLVDKKSPLATDSAMKAAGQAYNDYLIHHYGSEKMEYIKHLADIDTFSELTPEHIYRINCCTTNLEIQDIQSGIDSLIKLNQKSGDSSDLFMDFASDNIPEILALGVKKALNKQDPTLEDFKEWMINQNFSKYSIGQISNELLQEWLKLFLPSESELDRAFTGKKILGDIKGAYSCGQYDKFKPWLDQQELTQTFENLKSSASFESYLEKLTHIVVKKHLVRSHPDGLRVGALIPAHPSEKGGSPRWYYVSSCLTNQYNYSYTLESVCDDPTLPVIKLCRNTSPSSYALYSTKSIINDLNLLNSPGYMGIHMLDEQEEVFFNQRTIPLWVAYKELAVRKMKEGASLDEVYTLLEKANQALLRSENEKRRPLSFREILKKHDVILNELYLRNEQIYNFEGKILYPPFLNSFKSLLKQYIQVNLEQYKKISPDLIQADADSFKKLLETMISGELETREKLLIQSLIDDLGGKGQDEKAALDFQFQQAEHSYETFTSWANQLEELAKEQKENLASKRAQSTVITGQSLGGAQSQVLLARHFTNKERIPIPGHFCMLAEFDAPSINAEDNERFMAFGNENKELLKALEIKFSLFRRQEVGDIAPIAGEEHLGSVFSQKESEEIESGNGWLTFDAALNKRSKRSQKEEIASATTVHDTRFLEGRNIARGSITIENTLARRELTRDKKENYDYTELKFNPHIQGIFDSHGKKGGSNGQRIYEDLYHKFWKFPRFQLLNESFRKSTDYIACCIRRLLLSGREKDRVLETSDLLGRVTVIIS
jgi:hypothetical protein